MQENTTPRKDAENIKEKIRAKYQSAIPDDIDIIPALPQENFFEDDNEKRVAFYVRVSTDDPRQTSSFELQKGHYTEMLNRHKNWKLVEIYADEGISGTSLKHRDAFIKMIADCKAGKIDLIVTKSVSRFARNVVDCIGYVRQLACMQPPVGVFFEMESIYTLNDSSEMSLSFMSTLAQEESHIKSRVANDSIEKRFRRGIFLTPPLLGYDQDEDGNLVINPEEAKTVRLIFFMYLYGYTCRQIAEMLTSLARKTKKGNTAWAPGSILQILQNERHCGDILARKTWTPSYLDHLPRKNRNNHNQYTRKDNHEAIVSRDDFIAVQRLISNAKYGNKGILPELKVIMEGALKGFVSINPRWAAFSASDYRVASESVYDETDKPESKPLEVEAQSGDFDLRGFEVTRSQFFDTARKLCVTLSTDNIWFSTECIRKFKKELYVEMLIHPGEHLFAVRPCSKDCRNAVKWAKINEVNYNPRDISGAAYLSTLYEIFGWDTECRYRVRGVRRQKDNESVVIFDMKDTEIFIPDATNESCFSDSIRPVNSNPKNTVVAFPPSWAGNFGNNYYRHSQARELAAIDNDGMWNVAVEAQPYNDTPELNVTSTEIVASSIKQMINDMEQGETDDGIRI
jgi:site-specific DNA recombinase